MIEIFRKIVPASFNITSLHQDQLGYFVRAESTTATCSCPFCQTDDIIRFGKKERLVKDIPYSKKPVRILVSSKRYRCRKCSKTFTEIIPDVDKRRNMTKRLVNWIHSQAHLRTFLSISSEVGVSHKTIKNIFCEYLDNLEKTLHAEKLECIGIIEVFHTKPRTIIIDIQRSKPIQILPNCMESTISEYLAKLSKQNQIKYLSINLDCPYKETIQKIMPGAAIVINKNSFIHSATNILQNIAKKTLHLTPANNPSHLVEACGKNDHFILLKPYRQLSENEKLILFRWFRHYPKVNHAHSTKEAFCKIFDSKNLIEMQQHYLKWQENMHPSIQQEYRALKQNFERLHPYILNYFLYSVPKDYESLTQHLCHKINELDNQFSFEVVKAKILFS